MFTVFCDGHLLFDLKKHIVLTNPRLTIADNAAGALEFDIDPEHPMYDKIESMVSEIIVKQDGEEIWAGRATEQKTNFFGMKSVYCEGELAYLCDTIQEPSESHYTGNENVLQWLTDRIAAHNAKAPADKRFQVGAVTVVEPNELYRYTNYENTLECIKDKLIDRLGGHLRIRKVNGERFLDYLADYPGTAQQSIRFGLNLLEYSRTLTRADIATVCVPLGARLEEKDFPVLDKYLDVASVNDGSIYVENEQMVDSFGRIIKVVHWDDVATPENLLARARDWLNRVQFDDLRLEVNALDFHLADGMVPAIHLLDRVRVVSPPHGLDDWFPVTQLDIPLDNPAQMVFTLGKSERVSLTTRTNNALSSIDDDLETMPSAVLLQARKNATDLITSGALGGHVVVLPNELYITDSEDISAAQNMWRWNLNGLGYTKDGGKNYGTAITMDGKIVADYITAGQMSADRIFGGRIKLGGALYGNGDLYVYNSAGAEIGRWDKDGISVGAGTISGGTIKGASIQVGGNNDQEGTIVVHNSTGKEIGKWSKDGIDVTSGFIHGASVIVGGANNSNGSITVQNSSGTTIGTWNNSGITVKAGTITGGTINGAKITVGGKGDGSGTLTVNGDDGKAVVTLDKSGVTVKKGTITGTTISGNTISGGTIDGTKITGGTLTLGGTRAGSLVVQDAKGNEIGKWNSSGIDVKAGKITGGSISGAKLTVGGKNDADGTITVKDADGKQAVKLDKSGITVSKGTIKGATIDGNTITGGTISGSKISGNTISGGSISGTNISVGGKDNKTGWIKVYDKDNKTVNITLGQNGITVNKGSIKGTTISLGNKSNGDGSLTVKDANGSTVGTFDQNGITIKKGSIKIGSNFEVTTAGLLTAKSGTFKGTVDSGKIQSSAITGSSITGSSLTVGEKFKITTAGVLVSGVQDDFGTWIQLKDGIMTGGYGRASDKYGTIEFTAVSRDTDDPDTYYHGIQLTSELFRISAKHIAVTSGSNKNGVARAGYDGTISVVTKITDNGDGTISWSTGSIVFRHGLAVV